MEFAKRRVSEENGLRKGSTADGPYRVSLTDEDVGKKVRESKKRITWRFSLSRERTSEINEVVLYHSIVSGKRKILYNDTCVLSHEDLKARLKELVKFRKDGLLDYAWTTPDGLLLHINITDNSDGYTYELIVNNMYFSRMPPYFPDSQPGPRETSNFHDEVNTPARTESFEAFVSTNDKEKKKKKKKKKSKTEMDDFGDFGDDSIARGVENTDESDLFGNIHGGSAKPSHSEVDSTIWGFQTSDDRSPSIGSNPGWKGTNSASFNSFASEVDSNLFSSSSPVANFSCLKK